MGKKLNPCKFVSLLIACLYSLPAIAQEETIYSNGSTVIDVNQYTLYLANGQTISVSGLKWLGKSEVWKNIVGKPVTLEQTTNVQREDGKNRYGDLQGKIISPELGWVQKSWIARGLAIWKGLGIYPKPTRTTLLRVENEARISRRGEWMKMNILRVSALRKIFTGNEYRIIEGKVLDVRTIRGNTYINFGEDWKTDFTAEISSKNRAKFKKESWQLSELIHKWIRVRGLLRYYNGPYMELIFPDQIEILEPRQD